ncbi:MAG: rRNA pseudouridine synthase [Verrucomicrobiales bacterium]|nr:rRNA pseudouridine synthase [Verrucomicrobiales bacterium]
MAVQVRLHKFIAEAGVASRRAAERLMREGRVLVNGAPALEPGFKINPTTDAVTLDGRPIQARARRTVALHKPRGVISSKARQTPKQRLVTDCLPPDWSDLYPIGRLDRESEGLLLLTNDGEFCLRLTHPRYGVLKKYVATVIGKLGLSHLDQLRAGVTDRGELLRPQRVRLVSANASHSVVELDLTEGKQHEVRRLFAALGFAVERLQRIQIGPVKLGELPPGRWRVLAPTELEALRRSALQEPPGAGTGPATCRPGPPTRRRGFRASDPVRKEQGTSPAAPHAAAVDTSGRPPSTRVKP